MSSASSDTTSDTSTTFDERLYQRLGSLWPDEPESREWEFGFKPLDGALSCTLNNLPLSRAYLSAADEDKRSFIDGGQVTPMQMVNLLGLLSCTWFQLPIQVWVTS
jgi:hypothetical protein